MQSTAKDDHDAELEGSRSRLEDQSHQSPSGAVHTAFVQQRPLYVNLLDDLGSKDFFVIDGDSLLLECLSSPRIDVRHGGQPLHIFYLVEDFLHSLQACLNSRFCFAFYQHHESFWQAQDQSFLLLVRHLLQQHLRSTLWQTVHDFPSWQSPEWKEFINETQPAFVLMSDSSTAGQKVFTQQRRPLIKRMMQACVLHNLAINMPVALMAELRFQQDIAFGFKSTNLFHVPNVPGCAAAARLVEEHVYRDLKLTAGSVPQHIAADLFSATFPGMSWATVVGMKACAHLLQQGVTAQPELSPSLGNPGNMPALLRVCWAWCLHRAASGLLPIEQRSLDLERLEVATATPASTAPASVPSPELNIFIGQWCAVADQLPNGAVSGVPPTHSDLASLLDLFDGRLWHFMFQCVSTHRSTGLPPVALQEAEALMHAVCHAAGVAVADTARVISTPLASITAAAGSLNRSEGHPEAQLGTEGNPLVDAFLGPQGHAQQAEVDTKAAEELHAFKDAYHWHTGRAIEPSYLGETRQANLLAQYVGADRDINAMSQCPLLRPRDREHLLKVIHQETTQGLWQAEPRLRKKRMAEAAQTAFAKLRMTLERHEQRHATFMRNYAATLSKTIYLPSAQGNGAQGNSKACHKVRRPVVRTVDRQRAEIQTKKLAKDMKHKSEEWTQLQTSLETYAERNNKCWDEHMVSSVDRFLQKAVAISTESFLLASCFKLQGEMKAWQMECQGRARKAAAGTDPTALPQPNVAHAISIWLLTQSLLASGRLKQAAPEGHASKAANKAVKHALQLCKQAMQLLGFQDAAASIGDLLAEFNVLLPSKSKPSSKSSSRPTSASVSGNSNTVYHVGISEAEFQLCYCGDVLQRGIPAAKDPRVASFVPDAWQRNVLDAIDRRESCVICAPTSSGKTFISSFCMDRVINQSDEGVVVFVAPTKALVNQTAAQVLQDFGSKVVVGAFTRDFRYNEDRARILITVPACLEILLFSPTPAQMQWVKRLRYVIFDEVHCMREGGIKEGGAAENTGAIWEHCLLLIRCPLLALSATIGNPREVTSWLQSVKSLQQQQDKQAGVERPAASYNVNLIEYTERYADLRYHRYNQPDDHTLSEPAHSFEQMLQRLHPCAVLAANDIKQGGFPAQLNLEARDCLELFNSMRAVVQEYLTAHEASTAVTDGPHTVQDRSVLQEMLADLIKEQPAKPGAEPGTEPAADGVADPAAASVLDPAAASVLDPASVKERWISIADYSIDCLSPQSYFDKGKSIIRGFVLERRTVRSWEESLKAVLVCWASQHKAVGLEATSKVLEKLKQTSQWRPMRPASAGRVISSREFHTMLRGLDQSSMLPTLTFSFDRRNCESLAGGVTQILEADEADKCLEQPVDERAQRAAANRAEREARLNRDKQHTRRDNANAQYEDQAGYVPVDPNRVNPAFSFAGPMKDLRGGMSQEEVRNLIDLGTRKMSDDDLLLKGLWRGIGVHHSGLPLKYRQVVEILFRCGFLRVIIATGTLAYGINMPCRTVAFAGDHIFLNSLQFCQMSGRAGRRGFDTLGHVIFMEVPQRKVASLVVSPVPQLHGNFPLSVTLALRALTLQGAVTDDPEVTNDLLRLLQKPFYASEDPSLGQKMQHLFSYALVYLRRQLMVDSLQQTCGFAGLATHLFWSEPSNYAFVTLLRKRVFHTICENAPGFQQNPAAYGNVAKEVLRVMSHLFERVSLTQSAAQDAAITNSPSRVVLERLSPEVEEMLAEHNAEALDNFLTYIRGYVLANAAALPHGNVLPMSGLSYPAAAAGVPDAQGPSTFVSEAGGALMEFQKEVVIASPFVALSGQGENFSSVEEAVQCVRPGVLLDAASVPSVRNTDRHGCLIPLNRYILDYWTHGQKKPLTMANGMREGDAWEHLKSFVSILKAVATAMSKMVENTSAEADPVVWTFNKLAEDFQEKHKRFNSSMQQR